MKALTKPKTSNKTMKSTRKPKDSPKVIFGGGRNLGYISDTLFDEDLKR